MMPDSLERQFRSACSCVARLHSQVMQHLDATYPELMALVRKYDYQDHPPRLRMGDENSDSHMTFYLDDVAEVVIRFHPGQPMFSQLEIIAATVNKYGTPSSAGGCHYCKTLDGLPWHVLRKE